MSGTDVYKNNEAEFRNWAPGEPNNQNDNEECGQMAGNGEWNDVPCYLKFVAVCSSVREEKLKEVVPLVSKHEVKVRLEKSPSLSLKDSAVQDDMLQQLKKKLKE
ncbi:unnamed protein product [Oreochromis niloticus]|nr:unnamed protein product [Mustela putorius furo]